MLQLAQDNYQSEVRLRRMEADHSMDVESLLVRIEEEQQRQVDLLDRQPLYMIL